ncbi:NUDIX hydrolase [Acinetobacter radioresistens]|uniref:NUDIX hydrolase n=1 Tax=Acinetobacter radioresistens TaxID=40216 RepID=UPI002005B5EC|nr:NUDIX domain-containing protein [Acinetobacter radioresistens]MCK4103392.1 NUDIX domain-containing protein [Acinetobacter radioresistens]
MRVRRSSRLLVINENLEVLLFQFFHTDDALAGQTHWATVGGGVENNETFEQAACRELFEETGIVRDDVGNCVATRNFEMSLPSSEIVISDEKFFIVFIREHEVKTSNWTDHERKVIRKSNWWNLNDLRETNETVFPNNIPDILCRSFPQVFKI